MMKKLLLASAAIAALAFNTTESSAQAIKGFYKQSYKARNNGTFDKNTSIFSIGLGAPYSYSGYKSALPPVYLKYEFGLTDEIGLGFTGGLGAGKNRFNDDGYFTSVIGVLGYYHFNKIIPVKNLDVYLGAGFGAEIHNRTFNRDTEANIVFLGKAGARYYFTPGFGAYVETGYDALTSVNLGVTFRF